MADIGSSSLLPPYGLPLWHASNGGYRLFEPTFVLIPPYFRPVGFRRCLSGESRSAGPISAAVNFRQKKSAGTNFTSGIRKEIAQTLVVFPLAPAPLPGKPGSRCFSASPCEVAIFKPVLPNTARHSVFECATRCFAGGFSAFHRQVSLFPAPTRGTTVLCSAPELTRAVKIRLALVRPGFPGPG